MKIEIISIGDELIYGRIVDTNSAFLAGVFIEEGLTVCFQTVVGDDINDIKSAFDIATTRADIVIATGGLGPTKDDLTRDAIAGLCEIDMELDNEVWDDIKARFSKRGIAMSETNKVQAMVPKGAEVIPNNTGTAPGLFIKFKHSVIILLPGVPYEMKLMVHDWALPRVKKLINRDNNSSESSPDKFKLIKEINTYGLSESSLGEKIGHVMGPDKNPLVGTQASITGIKVRLCAKAAAREELTALVEGAEREIKNCLGNAVFGEGDLKLEEAVYNLLKDNNMTIAIAESCTGGLIASLLTDISGISQFLLEGVVAYSNNAKINILNVPEDIIIKHGAVSSETAVAMAAGARNLSGADIGIATTGIAGPTGETPGKPVGLVRMAVDIKGSITEEKRVFSGNRVNIKNRAAYYSLNMLRLRLVHK